MWRALFLWLIWSTLGTLILKMLVVLMLANWFLPPSFAPASTFLQSSLASSKPLFEETTVVTQELEREGAQQSKQPLGFAGLCDSFSSRQHEVSRRHTLFFSHTAPLFAFLPRKLPPSSEDEDGLSLS